MPVDVQDDVETVLIEIAAIYAKIYADDPSKKFTGSDVAVALRRMAQRFHEMRREWEKAS